MNTKFYGEIFMEQENLKSNGIYYPIKLNYFKTEETDEELKSKKYGIQITKTEYKDELQIIETNTINEITDDEEKIEKLLEIFKENEVTPVIAEDIIEDYLYKN